MFNPRDAYDPGLLPQVNIQRNTYIFAGIFMTIACIQWHMMQMYILHDYIRWSTPIMIIALMMATIFHICPALRHGYPGNIFFAFATIELMILGAGLMSTTMEIEVMISVTVASAYYVFVLNILAGCLQDSFDANPFCFLTSFFLCLVMGAILLYIHLILNARVVLRIGYFMVFYNISAMIIYHAMVVKSPQVHLYPDDFVLMGMLYCVDFICLFILAIMYFEEDVMTTGKYEFI